LLTLGVALWCVLASACSGAGESTGAVLGSSRDMAVAGSPAAEPDREAGAAGDAAEPSVTPGSAGMPSAAAKEPPTNDAGESSGGSTTGGPNVLPDGSDGASGGATVTEAPACGKQPDGTLCGPNMTPAGPEGARYFCSAGVIIAEAACPGPCDVETNACVQSGGTGGGTGGTNLHTVLRCRACYSTQCRRQLMACEAEPYCVAHLDCFETCNLNRDCYATCREVFKSEPLFGELDACVEASGCVDQCPAE
jgi:hypothetical protein